MWYIISGPSGSLKTTLINELQKRNYQICDEAATRLFHQYKSWEILHFPEEVFNVQLLDVLKTPENQNKPRFMDRSIVDTMAYLHKIPPYPTDFLQKNYHKKVFFMQEIIDKSVTVRRPDSLENRIAMGLKIGKLYKQLGFELCYVPSLPTEQQADFILQEI